MKMQFSEETKEKMWNDIWRSAVNHPTTTKNMDESVWKQHNDKLIIIFSKSLDDYVEMTDEYDFDNKKFIEYFLLKKNSHCRFSTSFEEIISKAINKYLTMYK